MKLIIRDDDLNYYTNPEELEYLYSDIWDKIPICFATIPKVGNVHMAIPSEKLNINKNRPIGENKELVNYLKKKISEGKIIIWQHGYTHRNYKSKFELERKEEKIITRELKEGKKYLENLFKIKIDTLVPPHDRISFEGIKAAEKIGFKNICRGYSPLPREVIFDIKRLWAFRKIFFFWLKNGKKITYPNKLKIGEHYEIYSYRIQKINHSNINKILKIHEDGILCITNHYRALNLIQKDVLKQIIKKWKKQ